MENPQKKDGSTLYLHKTKDTGAIFYVGIGSSKRPYSWRRNERWQAIAEHGYDVEILQEDIPYEDANIIETELILAFGRIGIEEGGVLANKSLGYGCIGYNYTTPDKVIPPRTAEHQRKLNEAQIGKKGHPMSVENKAKMSERLNKKISINGITYKSLKTAIKELNMTRRQILRLAKGYVITPPSDSHREAIRKAKKGTIMSEEQKAKISKTRLEMKHVICDNCKKEVHPSTYNRWHNNGKCQAK